MSNQQNTSSNHPTTPVTDSITPKNNGENKPRRGPRKRVLIPVILMLILAIAGYVYWDKNLRGFISTDDAFVEADQTQISSKILGRIVQLNTEEGDSVQSGELLVQLDDSDLKAQEAQAQSAALTAEQNVNVARVNLARAKDDLDRATAQIKDNVIPKEQFDHARQAWEAAQAQNDLASAQVNNYKSQLNVVQTQLKNTRIFAATPGAVAKRWVLSGDVVQPGQPILTIYNLGEVWVRANLEETKIAQIQVGDSVQVVIDAYAGRIFHGRVELIGSVTASQFSLIPPNNASGNFTKITQRIPVKIALTERPTGSESLPLRPGMSAVIKIRLKRH
jgi:membrane fusion protein, multidrug efflux system